MVMGLKDRPGILLRRLTMNFAKSGILTTCSAAQTSQKLCVNYQKDAKLRCTWLRWDFACTHFELESKDHHNAKLDLSNSIGSGGTGVISPMVGLSRRS
jgi:hypothetical protein